MLVSSDSPLVPPFPARVSHLLNTSVLRFVLLIMQSRRWQYPHLSWLNEMCTGTGTITWRLSCSLSRACKHTSCSSATPTCFTSCQFLPRKVNQPWEGTEHKPQVLNIQISKLVFQLTLQVLFSLPLFTGHFPWETTTPSNCLLRKPSSFSSRKQAC